MRTFWFAKVGMPRSRAASSMPAYQAVREKRATFAATPMQRKRRLAVDDASLANLALAGDWTATGLSATIEGSIRSGETAARFLLRHV
jgi:uncharacterized protein with NAD-binding domain and iron-sulfur cluster